MRGAKCLTLCVVVFAMNIVPGVHADNGPRIEDVAFKAECDGSEQHYVLLYPEGFIGREVISYVDCLAQPRW